MEVVDHQAGGWFLLKDAGCHYLDVNCPRPMVDTSILLRLDEEEEAELHGLGRIAVDYLATKIAYWPERFSSRTITRGDVLTEVGAAIARWQAANGLAPGQWAGDPPRR